MPFFVHSLSSLTLLHIQTCTGRFGFVVVAFGFGTGWRDMKKKKRRRERLPILTPFACGHWTLSLLAAAGMTTLYML